MIPIELKNKFEKTIEINNIDWKLIEEICKSDANILRPINGIAFEEYFKKIIRKKYPNAKIEDGEGDSDIDLYVNDFRLQLKTRDNGSTKDQQFVGVALHKTHGIEKRPFNLYSKRNKTFDFLVLQHPETGVFIIPFDSIPENNSWDGYLADPAKIEWNSKWLNRYGLIGFEDIDSKNIDLDAHVEDSELPFLSSITKLEDYEIVEMLTKPEYFRAAVMGLKGNIKEKWLINEFKKIGLETLEPQGAYPQYDCIIKNSYKNIRVQIKGTSKNMCSIENKKIGVEIMGTHGRFPKRGYKKDMIDYVAVVLSEEQLPANWQEKKGMNFIILPVIDLPLHYKINNGQAFDELLWDDEKFADIIYPNIKLIFNKNDKNEIEFKPDLKSYRKTKGFLTIPLNSDFRNAGPYILNQIPKEFNS